MPDAAPQKEKSDLAKVPAAESEALSTYEGQVHSSGPKTIIDGLIQNSNSASEAAKLIQVRGELLKQDAAQFRMREKAWLNRMKVKFQMVSWGATLLTGVGLIAMGSPAVGIFVVGGAISLIAPQFVKDNFKAFFLGGSNDKDDE
jgi:hypothetical protein